MLIFLGAKIDLSQGVFRPRVETKEWVGKVIEEIRIELKKQPKKSCRVLDIFAGSGCIGLAILKNISQAQVDFAEIDPSFINQIKINLKINQIDPQRSRVIQSNIFGNISKKYNYILANPPYIAKKRKYLVHSSVLEKDPAGALWSGKDGLKHLKKFLAEIKSYLYSGGKTYFEFSPEQKNKLEDFISAGMKIDFFKDKYGMWRWAKLQ